MLFRSSDQPRRTFSAAGARAAHMAAGSAGGDTSAFVSVAPGTGNGGICNDGGNGIAGAPPEEGASIGGSGGGAVWAKAAPAARYAQAIVRVRA